MIVEGACCIVDWEEVVREALVAEGCKFDTPYRLAEFGVASPRAEDDA